MTPVLELNPVSTSQEKKPDFKPVSDTIQILPESDQATRSPDMTGGYALLPEDNFTIIITTILRNRNRTTIPALFQEDMIAEKKTQTNK